jgi:hypothetical protein
MATASIVFHEPLEELKLETLDIHRAIVSPMEELEAFDWYWQRVDACTDEQLRAILEHNMLEEVEHPRMVLEWLRRHVPKFDAGLKTYLFTSGDITRVELAAPAAQGEGAPTEHRRTQPRATVSPLAKRWG